jgi:hypothetical protein
MLSCPDFLLCGILRWPYCQAGIFFIENSNLPNSCLNWETTRTAPLRMAGSAHGVCTITASLCCCGMLSCRLATGTCLLSTMISSLRSTACSTMRSTSISCPTPCFLMGARGPHGSSGPTWMMLWRRLLTWH